MTIEPNDFQSRLSVLLGLQSAVLTDEELSRATERYPQCRGKEHWDVREYVRRIGVGARQYRVVRGSSIEDVYRSAERVRAAAVGGALNKARVPGKVGEGSRRKRVRPLRRPRADRFRLEAPSPTTPGNTWLTG